MEVQWQVISGECIEEMAKLRDGCVDAIVTDPPYGLGFMGKKWDDLPPGQEWAEECLRVLKPGGHLLAFGGTRTYHRLTCAIEDAGFEIRDCLVWLYGSGFPKSHNVSKAIDKAAGATREVIGTKLGQPGYSLATNDDDRTAYGAYTNAEVEVGITAPATPEAQQWEGWGTALKPGWEPIVMARKPFPGTVAANVLEHGTGAIDVDACRTETADSLARRWPSNVAIDDTVAESMNGQSRYFYCAKASKGEREAGLEDFTAAKVNDGRAVDADNAYQRGKSLRLNTHPTVKPLALMRWLVKMVTPPDGIVLDPFTGSGSTGLAALEEGFYFFGIEREGEYVEIARARLSAH